MKCDYCGREVKDDAQFCSNCGHPLETGAEEINQPAPSDRGAYIVSVLSLIIVLALLAYGMFVIIRRDLNIEKNVSPSESNSDFFNYDSVFTDAALVGKWQCTDRAAADYGDSNFGVEVNILLSLSGDGKFTLDYNMTDTGIPAKSLSTSGCYSTEDGMITFAPDENPGLNVYLKRHGQRPSFQYQTDEGIFTLKYENGKDIVFKSTDE